MKMSKEWCLKQCLYYKGEEQCPTKLTNRGGAWSAAWEMEKLWVQEMTRTGHIPIVYSEQYYNAGLSDFNRDDGVHIDLKQFLYGYGLHKAEGMLSAADFRNWYDYKYKPFGDFYKEGH